MSRKDFIAGYMAGKKAYRKSAGISEEDAEFITRQVCDVIESDYSHESGDDLISTIFAVIDEALDAWEFGSKPKDDDINAVYDKVLVELDSRGIQIWPGERNSSRRRLMRKRAASDNYDQYQDKLLNITPEQVERAEFVDEYDRMLDDGFEPDEIIYSYGDNLTAEVGNWALTVEKTLGGYYKWSVIYWCDEVASGTAYSESDACTLAVGSLHNAVVDAHSRSASRKAVRKSASNYGHGYLVRFYVKRDEFSVSGHDKYVVADSEQEAMSKAEDYISDRELRDGIEFDGFEIVREIKNIEEHIDEQHSWFTESPDVIASCKRSSNPGNILMLDDRHAEIAVRAIEIFNDDAELMGYDLSDSYECELGAAEAVTQAVDELGVEMSLMQEQEVIDAVMQRLRLDGVIAKMRSGKKGAARKACCKKGDRLDDMLNENKSSDCYQIYWLGDEAHMSDGEHSVLIGYESDGLDLIDRLPMCEDALDNWQE